MRFPWQKKSKNLNIPDIAEPGEKLCYKVYSISEAGPTRSQNEDSIMWLYPGNYQQSLFAMVADGMGGHNAGEVASNLACSVAEHYMQSNPVSQHIPSLLEDLFQQMHHTIVETATGNADYGGMGSTAACVFINNAQIVFAHAGDSRIYKYRNNVLSQLSTDHTLVNQLIRQGKLKAGDTEAGKLKHLLLQALGTAQKIEPEIGKPFTVKSGDYFFLCSDGIYDVLNHEEIAALFSMRKPYFIIECIKSLGYQRNAQDNFSALIIEVKTNSVVNENAITREQNVML